MEIYQEYASWIKEIEDFYLEIKEHNLALYERFMPIYEVLNYIYLNTLNKTLESTDDLERIFVVGFEYLHDQVAQCILYLETAFKNDFHEFVHYDELIALLLYIEDVRYELSEKQINVETAKLEGLLDEIEEMITSHKPIPNNYSLYVDDLVKSVINDHAFDFYGIIDIFVDVAETLGVYLYEEDDFTIGKDV